MQTQLYTEVSKYSFLLEQGGKKLVSIRYGQPCSVGHTLRSVVLFSSLGFAESEV